MNIELLKASLTEAEAVAAEMLKDKVHGQSPYAGPLRARLVAAVEALDWHAKWLTENPAPDVPIVAAASGAQMAEEKQSPGGRAPNSRSAATWAQIAEAKLIPDGRAPRSAE